MKKSPELQHLHKLAFAAQKLKYLAVPEAYLPKPKFTETTNKGLCLCIKQWLLLHGHKANSCGHIVTATVNGQSLDITADVLHRQDAGGMVCTSFADFLQQFTKRFNQ